MAYDLINLREPVGLPADHRSKDLDKMPEAMLMFYSTLLVFDHVKHQIIIIRNVPCELEFSENRLRIAYRGAIQEIRGVEKKLQEPLRLVRQKSSSRRRASSPLFHSNFSKERFLD